MSEHDPFDGDYDGEPQGRHAESLRGPVTGAPPQQESESAPAASEVAHPETYTRSQLERMRKAELQVAARERGLSTLGDRDDLIERIDAAQKESAAS